MSLKRIIGAIHSATSKRIYDTFTRTNATSLEKTEDGSTWLPLRGSFRTNGSQAVSTDSPSTYPAARIDFPSTNVTINMMDVQNGSGSLLWVTDSNNWWAVDVYQYSYVTCGSYAPYYVISGYYSYCATPSYSSGCSAYYCNGFNHAYYKNATYCKTTCKTYYYYVSGCIYTATGTNYAYGGTYCTGNVTVYPRYIRLLRMLAGSVSEIASAFVGNSQYVGLVKTTLSGTSITATAYSDGGSAQIGQIVYNATGATITPSYGIVITPQGISQGSSVGQIEILRND